MNTYDRILEAINKIIEVYKPLSQEIIPVLEPTKVSAHGDLSTNIAMRLAVVCKKKPRDIAKEIIERLNLIPDVCEKIDIAGPGFINFYLSKSSIADLLKQILVNSKGYGRTEMGKGKSALIEFVSANPTGPLTIAHARQAAVGDVLGNIMENAGYKVEKEYYLNDRGRQMRLLAKSTRVRYLELLGEKVDFPEDGYKGEYMVDIARHLLKEVGEKYKNISEDESLDFFHKYTENKILDMIKKDLADFRVHFKNWVSETELVASGVVEKTLKLLEEKGYVFNQEGAVWFRSTQLGDDKDRVLIKSTGEMTYLVPDVAYHNGKYQRGFNIMVDLWGPDHHGYIPRLKAAMKALGNSAESLNVLIVQLTTLYRNGQQLSMSTRAGEFVSLRDLLDEVGCDAARYYLVMRRPESHLDFDLEIAKKETADNPVYYIQYAYARISSIFNKYEEFAGISINDIDFNDVNIALLKETEEVSLIKFLSQYPVVIEDSARILGPHLLTDYLEALVSRFHTYYEKYKVVGSNEELAKARIILIRGVQIVLQNALNVLGISIPERM